MSKTEKNLSDHRFRLYGHSQTTMLTGVQENVTKFAVLSDNLSSPARTAFN